uniref:Mth938-like domain-containing protein n=1 Tax=uncultured Thiotrichaceae bacterium TaxID=298394 RepID=A0A6S6TNR5_9GAMM|nr:MAG: Unknown protein [uncultured Thiotrichaceae bacterium]
MKFSEEPTGKYFHLQSYGDGWIQVNQRRIERGFIISADTLSENWEPQLYADLKPEHLTEVFALHTELILIGTGKNQQLPAKDIHKTLIQNQIGFEFMTTDAACRTYNVLLSESRNVAAILFPE